jgi:hypothetical protein
MFVLSFAGPDHAATVLRQWLELVESVRPPVPADPTDAF